MKESILHWKRKDVCKRQNLQAKKFVMVFKSSWYRFQFEDSLLKSLPELQIFK